MKKKIFTFFIFCSLFIFIPKSDARRFCPGRCLVDILTQARNCYGAWYYPNCKPIGTICTYCAAGGGNGGPIEF